MIVNFKNLKTVVSGFWIFFLFMFISISSCSTPAKKVDDSVDNVESSSNQATEQPADSLAEKDNEHPADHEAGDEHPTDSEHPNN